jgi:hypothetical protein
VGLTTEIMKLIKDYEAALKAIYDHVGFVEDWVIYPLDDCTEKYWDVNEEDKEVHYADSKQELEEQDGSYYVDELYTQRFYSKWVYEGEDFTMVFCNPGVDGMKWFRLFDNSKRVVAN